MMYDRMCEIGTSVSDIFEVYLEIERSKLIIKVTKRLNLAGRAVPQQCNAL